MSRPTKLYARWSAEMRRGRLFVPGDRVGVAVSGGQDSVLLLDFLHQFARERGLVLSVVHFNHHLRGEESEGDEQFVARRAAGLGLKLICGGADVARIARAGRRNLEATARELRYRFFFSLVNQNALDKVSTAHTASDQAETVLLRLLRGTGTRGLAGIYPILDGKVVRPFLDLTRSEIAAEVRLRELEFRVDSSNRDPRLARNRIRATLLPLLEKEFNPAIVQLLKDVASRAREDENFLQWAAAERARPWRIREGKEEKIAIRPLVEFPPAMERRVLRDMILSTGGTLRGITSHHIEALRHFTELGRSGQVLVLPGGLAARKEFDWLVLSPRPDEDASPAFEYPVTLPAEVPIPQLNLKLRLIVAENVDEDSLEKRYTKSGHIDLDKLAGSLVLRNWQPGDRFQPLGSGRASKLKELFLKHRIPLKKRRVWPVLSCGGELVWVYHFPPSQRVLASRSSRRTLIVAEEPLGVDAAG